MCLGVPGRVIELEVVDGLRMAKVDFGGVSRLVCVEHVDPEPGDYVLVHVGFALAKLAPAEAAERIDLLRAVTGERDP